MAANLQADIALNGGTGWTPELRTWLDKAAHETGFHLAGVAAVDEPEAPSAARDAERFADWIDAGHAGEMDYLKRRDQGGSLVRSSLRGQFPWVRSVIVCALDYNAVAPFSIDAAPSSAGWIARYAWSGRSLDDGTLAPSDYHDELLGRLRRIESDLLTRTGCTTRCYVDTGPLVERSFAAAAGIGWIGKNTCVIHQQRGSWLLLGVILTSLPVDQSQEGASMAILPTADRCGTCTRCIDACPTGALLGSSAPESLRGMDASRCIAYLTIEKKGSVSEEFREPIGRNVFGCDICQEVCPWNRKAAAAQGASPQQITSGMQPRAELVNPALEWLATLDSAEFRRRFRGSPLERTGRKRILRNVAIAMGNSCNPEHLPKLDAWANGETRDLSAQEEPNRNDLALEEAAAWAAAKLRKT